MAVSWQDVVDLDASLASVPQASQTAILSDAYLLLSKETFGDRYDLAIKYFVAHTALRVAFGGSGVTGVVTSESLGSASRSYAQPSGGASFSSSELGTTIWGQRFLFLLRSIITMDVI